MPMTLGGVNDWSRRAISTTDSHEIEVRVSEDGFAVTLVPPHIRGVAQGVGCAKFEVPTLGALEEMAQNMLALVGECRRVEAALAPPVAGTGAA